MSPQDALAFYSTKTRIAETLGIAVPSVIQWFDEGKIPETRQYQIELATGGKLVADRPADRLSACQSASA